jgi:ABC-type multidrug transport system permease subunit
VDYRLFPDLVRLMRIHHLLWFSGVVFLVAVLYRRLIGPSWVAALAVIMFLIDDNNFFPLLLIAHRNSFLALVFGLLCTLCHHHWRENNSMAGAIAAPILLLLSLFSAEAGIASFRIHSCVCYCP